MKHPWLVWLAFAACAAVGFGVLGWFTHEMLRLERESAEGRRLAAQEENIRLALWRMDSALASVHGLEAARPWQEYESFFRADSAFSRDLAPLPSGTIMLPSPLLAFTPPFVRLHFQVETDGTLHSPQAPAADLRPAALAAGVTVEQLDAAQAALATLAPNVATAQFSLLLPPPQAVAPDALAAADLEARKDKESSGQTLADRLIRRRAAMENEVTIAPAAPVAADEVQQVVPTPAPRQEVQQQQQLKSAAEQFERDNTLYAANEYNAEVARNRTLKINPSARTPEAAAPVAMAGGFAPQADSSDRTSADGYARREVAPATASASAPPVVADPPADTDAAFEAAKSTATIVASAVVSGPLQAVWLGDELVFARRVSIDDREAVQGAWLDWSELRAWLLSRVSDLLPGAQLEPVRPGTGSTAFTAIRRLAFLPVQLVPGAVRVAGDGIISPLQLSLGTAWASALIGVLALALLLRGTLRLSERRGAFVSAVTHELRTPLTTFRMYTEMLAGGMVADEAKRRSYVDTLRKEAERLSHLVENVLSYARLERGRAASRVEDTTPGALLARIEERLRQRAAQGGLELRVGFADGAADLALRTDTTAVEQILFNLVDNATKYGRPVNSRTSEITVTVTRHADDRGLTIHVADRGPGIAMAVRRRLFQPFSKSATEAAHSQPGVGLGLALSRRLARDELHGDLVLERTGPDGTVFRLELPAR